MGNSISVRDFALNIHYSGQFDIGSGLQFSHIDHSTVSGRVVRDGFVLILRRAHTHTARDGETRIDYFMSGFKYITYKSGVTAALYFIFQHLFFSFCLCVVHSFVRFLVVFVAVDAARA